MAIGAIVQARMRSKRLPGKVLREVGGRAILEHLLERLGRAASLDLIVVATSSDASDDAVAARCELLGVACHRGPLDDVARRFAEVVDRYDLAAFVRVSADSPLLDPALVDRVVAGFADGVDIATNIYPRTFPKGQSVEVVDAGAFRSAIPLMDTVEDREHVTTVMYRHARRFKILNISSERDVSGVRMVVDDSADLGRFEQAIALMSRPSVDYSLHELLEIYRDLSRSTSSP